MADITVFDTSISPKSPLTRLSERCIERAEPRIELALCGRALRIELPLVGRPRYELARLPPCKDVFEVRLEACKDCRKA